MRLTGPVEAALSHRYWTAMPVSRRRKRFERLRAVRADDYIIRDVVEPTVVTHAGTGTFRIVYHPLAGP